MPRKPETTWEMLNEAMGHFQHHIQSKPDRYSLSIVDLLHVSNFKGGNASITEPRANLENKLRRYEGTLREIARSFPNKTLSVLTDAESSDLINLCDEFLALTNTERSQIRGFGPSYASALLAAHFMNLIPVLDRRALNGAGIQVDKDSQGQVKNISKHYGQLIRAFRGELLRRPGTTVRQLDREWFTADI